MEVKELLEKVQSGELTVREAERYLQRQPFEEMGYVEVKGYLLRMEK